MDKNEVDDVEDEDLLRPLRATAAAVSNDRFIIPPSSFPPARKRERERQRERESGRERDRENERKGINGKS